MKMIAKAKYITLDNVEFDLELLHEKYKHSNYYKLYRNGEICAEGNCPKDYTPRLIFNHWIKAEGTIQTFKVSQEGGA